MPHAHHKIPQWRPSEHGCTAAPRGHHVGAPAFRHHYKEDGRGGYTHTQGVLGQYIQLIHSHRVHNPSHLLCGDTHEPEDVIHRVGRVGTFVAECCNIAGISVRGRPPQAHRRTRKHGQDSAHLLSETKAHTSNHAQHPDPHTPGYLRGSRRRRSRVCVCSRGCVEAHTALKPGVCAAADMWCVRVYCRVCVEAPGRAAWEPVHSGSVRAGDTYIHLAVTETPHTHTHARARIHHTMLAKKPPHPFERCQHGRLTVAALSA